MGVSLDPVKQSSDIYIYDSPAPSPMPSCKARGPLPSPMDPPCTCKRGVHAGVVKVGGLKYVYSSKEIRTELSNIGKVLGRRQRRVSRVDTDSTLGWLEAIAVELHKLKHIVAHIKKNYEAKPEAPPVLSDTSETEDEEILP
jgi:hypothetical protein